MPEPKRRRSWTARWRQGRSAPDSPEESQGGSGLLALLESQQHQPACLTETGQATRTAGEQIKKGHIFASSSSPANTPQLGFGNTEMIQHQGTSACFVGATPRVSVDQIGRLDPLPCGSKLGALQKRGGGLTQDLFCLCFCANSARDSCKAQVGQMLLWRRMWAPCFCHSGST